MLRNETDWILQSDSDNDTNTADIDCNTFVLKKEGFLKIIDYLRSGGGLIN